MTQDQPKGTNFKNPFLNSCKTRIEPWHEEADSEN